MSLTRKVGQPIPFIIRKVLEIEHAPILIYISFNACKITIQNRFSLNSLHKLHYHT